MRTVFKTTLYAICISFLLNSCKSTTKESKYQEFEIEFIKTHYGGIYIPRDTKFNDRLPVVYMADGLLFKECNYKHIMDSLIDNKCIKPVIIVCSYENREKMPGQDIEIRLAEYVESVAINNSIDMTRLFVNHYHYFYAELMPYIEQRYPVSRNREDRVFMGTSLSADFGLTLSLRNPELFQDFWCYSPLNSDISVYGMLNDKVHYTIAWSAKEETEKYNYFPELVKNLRKRGGEVTTYVYNSGYNRQDWEHRFKEELKHRFPYTNQKR